MAFWGWFFACLAGLGKVFAGSQLLKLVRAIPTSRLAAFGSFGPIGCDQKNEPGVHCGTAAQKKCQRIFDKQQSGGGVIG
jgi:hypothetical protein